MSNDNRPVINWTRPMLERFKRRYEMAAGEKRDTVTFDGHEFAVGFAKYLIEYLETRLPK